MGYVLNPNPESPEEKRINVWMLIANFIDLGDSDSLKSARYLVDEEIRMASEASAAY